VQSSSKDFKTKKIFVGGLPSTLTEGNISMTYDGSALCYINFALMIVLFVNLDQTNSRVSLQDMGLWWTTRLCLIMKPNVPEALDL
jgi:hypothetical protein